MATIKIHFYRGDRIFSKIIQWRTYSPYSHVSVQIGDTIYEARERYGVRSVPVGPLPKSLVHTKKYNISKVRLQKVLEYLESRVGWPYDYLGLFSFAGLPKKKKDNKKCWCSEYAHPACLIAGIAKDQDFPVSPGNLFLLLK